MSTRTAHWRDQELRFWLTVARAPHLHADHLRPAFAQAGGPAALWCAPAGQLRELGLPPAASALLAQPPAALLEADRAFLARSGARLLPFTDGGYPPLLATVPAAPAALYVLGDPQWLHRLQLAMVGSRHPTAPGRGVAYDFARDFAAAGITVTSGLARGIDAASHQGALDGGGATIAVCGTGLDRVYPAQHAALAARIAASGALVSEFPPGTPPLAANFPRRNRILSGLARGLLVVEAAPGSGSLITARHALEQGREVFAIPGPIRSPQSAGCHALLRDGAGLVTSPADVLAELGLAAPLVQENINANQQSACHAPPSPATPRLDKAEEILLDALGFEPASIDELVERTGLPAGSIASMLLILELDLRVAPQPGGRYCRIR